MNDRAVSLLDQYEIEVAGTRKGRGAILCDTDRGTLIFKEYAGSPQHLRVQDRLLRTIAEKGLVEAEQLIPTKEGEFSVKDHDGISYILKTYREGRECNIREPEECLAAIRQLAKLHLSTQEGLISGPGEERRKTSDGTHGDQDTDLLVTKAGESVQGVEGALEKSKKPSKEGWGNAEADQEDPVSTENTVRKEEQEAELPPANVMAEYEKRNRELRRIRKFLLGRSQKTWFEISLLGCFDQFYDQAREAQEGWKAYQNAAQREDRLAYCHGDYQYHNILLDQKNWYLINFERCIKDDPVRDLHLLLRKLLEKSGWSAQLGEKLLREYERIRPLSAISRIDLYYRLSYPEKFWKIANFYYNSGKAWIPGKNLEKLEKLLSQETEKKSFLETVFRV
ncbi:MAG: phosphotransferase [Lachnospiraceae bacterium]|nr:phosphotransferase [Lachnospiraceae bacterium]